MTPARPDWYKWPGGREAMLRFGPDTGPVVVAALPLFEEANRTRALVASILRALAERDTAGILPDVPGQGDSLRPVTEMTQLRMAEALEALTDTLLATNRRTYSLAIRSGALLDICARHSGRWHLAPVTGDQMLRDLHRVWLAAAPRPAGARSLDAMMYGSENPVPVAGNLLSADLLTSFAAATPFAEPGVPLRILRLDGDPRPADRHLPGRPLWRAAEPGNDPALAAALADDIAAWIARCEA